MYELQIAGELDDTTYSTDGMKVPLVALDDLSVQLSINEEGMLPSWRCSGCGDESQEDEAPVPGEPCDGSGNYVSCGDHVLDEDGDCESCDGTGEIEVHDWDKIPLHWLNSASIHTDTVGDRVYVTISVGDPRGAFVMRVERCSDGELRLSVPHERMSLPHMPLHERGPGFFMVGN